MNSILKYRDYTQWVILMEKCKKYELEKKNVNFSLFSSEKEKMLYQNICDKYDNYKTKEHYNMLLEKELKLVKAQKDYSNIEGKFAILQPLKYFEYIKALKIENENKSLLKRQLKDTVIFNENSKKGSTFSDYINTFKSELNNLVTSLNQQDTLQVSEQAL